jgi:hypothetical protein
MMDETEQLVINDGPRGGLWHTFNFYLKQPRIMDWIIGLVVISAIIATIIIIVF